mmetsp:Transcript_19189/g.44554  ORF Transcript_19189/g.44554 Transcript_19189/m.44554 type:complete len:433 (-) Transcript_19189:167-1465(-)|eukprot:CAMPEP_0197182716 /NCGR_PEP_ID=MMETSP1423-20130617/6577_1 /TAXON_ID=476441 /ORGANISM="Pseudo-nitzschia heimii, Strain UNC1101" /LENGTH=432 /DNA_ID=CAMNT_0042633175 /DNA_START=186 /DNA_END=1484 /DNA_ORIENTATION=+
MNVTDTHQNEVGKTVDSAFRVNRNRNEDVEEEMPLMRAVALESQTAKIQFSKSSVEGKRHHSVKEISTLESKSRNAAGVCHEGKDCNWNVSILNEIPLEFPLERTRREIYKVPVAIVVERITECFRLLSIEANFDSENAKAKCKTSDMVNFRVRLFAGEARKQEPIIVEIQRRSGSPRCFMHVCKKLLDAVDGAKIQSESVPARKNIPSGIIKTPVHKMKCLQNVEKQDPIATIKVGINKSLEMLRTKKIDVVILGLENLCFITDPLKTRPDMASMSCRAMIMGNYLVEIRDEIGEMLENDASLLKEFKSHPCKEVLEKCRYLVIVLFTNVLALTSQDGCLEDAVKKQKWFTDFLIPSLVDEVKSFESSSNNAYEAACGLTFLAICSDIARRKMKEKSAVDDLQSAYHFAMCNHDLLASETKTCLNLLGYTT